MDARNKSMEQWNSPSDGTFRRYNPNPKPVETVMRRPYPVDKTDNYRASAKSGQSR